MLTIGDLTLRSVPVVEPSNALDETIALLRAEPLRTVVLVGDEQFMGIFNEDALTSNLIPVGANLSDLAVGPYVHPVRLTVNPATPVAFALVQMKHRNTVVLPVVRNGTVYMGVLTRGDLEKAAEADGRTTLDP